MFFQKQQKKCCVQQRWLTNSTFSHMVTCVACLQSPHYDRNESEPWILFTSIKLFQTCFTLYTIYGRIYVSSNVNKVIKTILDFFIQKQLFKRSQETSFCSYVWKYYYWCGGTTIPLLFACSILCFCLVESLCFCCFQCMQNLFVKKIKSLKLP